MTIDSLIHDLRMGWRALLGRPRFSLLALAAFTVGIGSNTAVFRLVDDALLDSLPWPEADRAALVWETYPERGLDRLPAAPAKYLAWREQTDVFDAVAAYRWATMDLQAPDGPERARVGVVDPRLFELLGVAPGAGRLFRPDEERPGAGRVAILSHAMWRDRFGGDPAAVGGTLVLDGEPWEIVGALPPGDAWPDDVELYVPLTMENPESRAAHAYRALARLAPGATIQGARQRVETLAARWEAEYPETDAGFGVRVETLRQEVVGDLSSLLLLLQGAVGLVLLIACANAAALLLVHVGARRRELAVRASLGASRLRLGRQLVAESVLLSVGGALLGLPLSGLGVRAMSGLAPEPLPGEGAALDPTVVLFVLGLSLGVGVLFGALPAIQGTAGNLMERLRESGSTPSSGRGRTRAVIVGAEIALATVLVVASALLLRSLGEVSDVDPGFEAPGLLAAELQPPRHRYPEADDRVRLYGELIETVEGRPGIESAALVSHMPVVGRTDIFRFLVEGRPPPRSQDELTAQVRAVTPGYFATLDIEILEGRAFGPGDRADGEPVALVDEVMARTYWPGEDPVGQRISVNGPEGPWLRIVGLAEAVRHDGLTREPAASFYLPMAQEPWPSASLVVRTPGDPLPRVGTVRSAVSEVDPLLPLGAVRTGGDILRTSTGPWRFQALLVGAFGAGAAALAVLGVFGLLSFTVQERRREMGIRRALGAEPGDVRRLVRKGALRLALPGVGLGLVGAALAAALLRGLLFGVPPLDPASYLGAGTLLLAASMGAAWWPARRAATVEPGEVLRTE